MSRKMNKIKEAIEDTEIELTSWSDVGLWFLDHPILDKRIAFCNPDEGLMIVSEIKDKIEQVYGSEHEKQIANDTRRTNS
jgi:hypothetical protein